MHRSILVLTTAILALSACSDPKPVAVDWKAEFTERIDSLEANLKSADGELEYDSTLADNMIVAYNDFVEAFPEDSMSVFYRFRLAQVYRNVPGKELYSIEQFAYVFEDYREHQLAPQALFMSGVVWDEINDKSRASKTFEEFLNRYPEHPWASDAEQMLMLTADTVDLDAQVNSWLNKSE